MAVAAIDCGTNSIRLLITDQGRDLVRELRIVGLGRGLEVTGRLDPEAIERTRAALVEYRELIDSYDVDRLRMVATSAARDAKNASEFQAMVLSVLGREAEVISGDQEAQLAFAGAVTGLPTTREYLVVDIGGGSTEFVRGSSRVHVAKSVNVGTVRIFERHLHTDPPSGREVDAAVTDIALAVRQGLQAVYGTPATLVGVAGAVTTIAAIAAEMNGSEMGAPLHHWPMPASAIEAVTTMLCIMTHAQRAAIKVIHPGRVDVITCGALILREVVRQIGADSVVVSERDLLDGIAMSLTD